MCYVTLWGWVGVNFPGKKRYEGVRFNVTRGWVGVKFPGKKRYVTLEWPLTSFIKICILNKPRATRPISHRARPNAQLIPALTAPRRMQISRTILCCVSSRSKTVQNVDFCEK